MAPIICQCSQKPILQMTRRHKWVIKRKSLSISLDQMMMKAWMSQIKRRWKLFQKRILSQWCPAQTINLSTIKKTEVKMNLEPLIKVLQTQIEIHLILIILQWQQRLTVNFEFKRIISPVGKLRTSKLSSIMKKNKEGN